MQVPRLTATLLWAVPAMLLCTPQTWAAGPTGADKSGTVSADLYLSPAPGTGLVVPSGAINISPNINKDNSPISNSFVVPAPTALTDDEVSNLQGCGGVGQGEFTSALYNMPENFKKFQTDVNSVMARELLTMNYVMPQTAALFDQLNNYGNQRYESFQRGCNLDALKQDARKQYLEACVAKLTPIRKVSLTTLLTGTNAPSPDMLNAMAYSQAWEVCSNQYVSDTAASTVRKEVNKSFAEKMRTVQDVNAAIKPLLCTKDSEDAGGSGCWLAYLIPQVRLCFDGTIAKTCEGDEDKAFGSKEPIIPMPRLFDAFRFLMDDELVSRRVMPMQSQIKSLGVDSNMRRSAATEAALIMSTGSITRMSSTSSTFAGGRVTELPDESVLDFQLNYLSCKNPDLTHPLSKYLLKLNAAMTKAKMKAPDGKIAAATFDEMKMPVFRGFVLDKMKFPKGTAAEEADALAFAQMLNVSLSCTVNQTIPMLDPNLTASISSCSQEDLSAFYAMSGYDVSLAATRDVYRYLNLRLKQTYARLLTQNKVPSPTTTGTAPSPTISPEINNRLATTVKEIMIPYVESQILRLDELNNNRGQFAQRVQKIYADRKGCVYGGDSKLR